MQAYANVQRRAHGLCILVSRTDSIGVRHIHLSSAIRTLQFLVSPYIGSLSDKYGRKKILLISMVGNILSALVYV
jgi:MFS family permease